MSQSSTHLILVVHGIGEQISGDTVDEVVAGAVAKHPTRPVDDLAESPISIQSSHLTLTENDFARGQEDPVEDVFECHLHTLAPVGDTTQRAVFAEVHWSDLSPAPKGAIATILDLLKLILGLGYIAMDNVENTKDHKFHRGIVHFFNWVFYGGIAALHAILLLGTVFLLARGFTPNLNHGFVILGCAFAGFGLWAWLHQYGKKNPRFLVTVFRRGVLLQSAVIVALMVALAAFGDAIQTLLIKVYESMPETLTVHSPGCGRFVRDTTVDGQVFPKATGFGVDSVSCFVEFSLFVSGLMWVLAAVLVVLSLVGVSGKAKRVIYPSICSAMLVFWGVFTTGFWLALRQLLGQFDKVHDDCLSLVKALGASQSLTQMPEGGNITFGLFCLHLEKGVGTLALSVTFLILLIALAIRAYFKHERVILNRSMRWLLSAFPVALVVTIVWSGDLTLGAATVPGDGWHATFTSIAVSISLGIALLIYNFNETVAAGLGVARDVIVYLVRAECKWMAPIAERESNYPRRAKIEARFERVFRFMLHAEGPDRITVISHSQGTVIAARALARLIEEFEVTDPTMAKKIRLITMGSPISHIYEEYFPENYVITRDGISPDLVWHNLYRSGDFVGKTIGTTDIPQEHDLEVGRGGHSHYFTDERVWNLMWGPVGFRLFSNLP